MPLPGHPFTQPPDCAHGQADSHGGSEGGPQAATEWAHHVLPAQEGVALRRYRATLAAAHATGDTAAFASDRRQQDERQEPHAEGAKVPHTPCDVAASTTVPALRHESAGSDATGDRQPGISLVSVLLGVATVLVSAVLTAGAGWLGWWASGGGYAGLFPGMLLGGFAAWVAFGMYVPFAFIMADAGSIRQAKKALHEAERNGRFVAAFRARARLRVARWQRRG